MTTPCSLHLLLCVAAVNGAPASPVGERDGGPALGPVLTLDQALKTAMENQPTLRGAVASAEAGDAREREAFAPLLPQVQANAGYTRTTANYSAKPGFIPQGINHNSGGNFASYDYMTFGANASELVYDFSQTSGKWRSAQSSAESLHDDARSTRDAAILAVETAYFNARAEKSLVQVGLDTLDNQQSHLHQVEGFVEVGTHPEIDLAQARTNEANARFQLIQAENGYETAKAQLNQTMGVERDTSYEVENQPLPELRGENGSLDTLLDEALYARPEIASFAAQIRAQQSLLDSATGGYFPSLGVATNLSDNGTNLTALVPNWNAQATLSWSLFQGFLTDARAEEARANIRVAQAQLQTQRQQVRLDVQQARLAIRAGKQELSAGADALESAKVQLQLAEGRYATGVGINLDVSDAEVAVTNAAAQYVKAEFDLATARAQMIKALGRFPGAPP